MALPGMRSTNDMGTDGRPLNWREGLLLNSPRNNAPLFSLTAAMRSQETDDPEFRWWEEKVDFLNYTLNDGDGMTNADTVFVVDERATRLKIGDLLQVLRTGEVIRISAVTNDTTFSATRGTGNTSAAALLDNEPMTYIGSAYREGAGRATGTSFNPTKQYNYTQIFRDPIEWTRTAMKTRLRYTTSIQKEDRRRAMHKHAVGIERAMWLGPRFETIESGQPIRYTGGIMTFIPPANKQQVQGPGGVMDMDELMSYFPRIFEFGSSEKLAFGSIQVLTYFSELVRKNSQFEWGTNDKDYGLNIRRLITPAGVLSLTEHPLFGQEGQFMQDGLVVIETGNLKYRYIDDTELLKDREDRGTDGKAEEYLTECGLEVGNPNEFFYLYGIKGAARDS